MEQNNIREKKAMRSHEFQTRMTVSQIFDERSLPCSKLYDQINEHDEKISAMCSHEFQIGMTLSQIFYGARHLAASDTSSSSLLKDSLYDDGDMTYFVAYEVLQNGCFCDKDGVSHFADFQLFLSSLQNSSKEKNYTLLLKIKWVFTNSIWNINWITKKSYKNKIKDNSKVSSKVNKCIRFREISKLVSDKSSSACRKAAEASSWLLYKGLSYKILVYFTAILCKVTMEVLNLLASQLRKVGARHSSNGCLLTCELDIILKMGMVFKNLKYGVCGRAVGSLCGCNLCETYAVSCILVAKFGVRKRKRASTDTENVELKVFVPLSFNITGSYFTELSRLTIYPIYPNFNVRNTRTIFSFIAIRLSVILGNFHILKSGP